MSVDRAEQIMIAAQAALQSLISTATPLPAGSVRTITRERTYPENRELLPAINLVQGDDEREDVDMNTAEDAVLPVVLEIVTESLEVPIVGQLNQIAAEAHKALLATDRLGLAFVFDVVRGGRIPFDENATDEGRFPMAGLEAEWLVTYRYNRIDPTTDP